MKSDLAGTKSELDKTKSELKKVSGDLGITSGYVATNSKEIEDLRRRGERNIIEFSIKKQKNMQKVENEPEDIAKTTEAIRAFTGKVPRGGARVVPATDVRVRRRAGGADRGRPPVPRRSGRATLRDRRARLR